MPVKVEQRRVEDLIPYARNSRTHSDEQVAQIAASIHAIELNPAYVDVAVIRWQEFTGQQAVHEDGRLFDDMRADRNAKVAA